MKLFLAFFFFITLILLSRSYGPILTNNLSPNQGVTITTQSQGISNILGYSVSNAGDFNGDGIDDIIISSPSDDQNTRGVVYVIFGSKDGFSDLTVPPSSIKKGIMISGFSPDDKFGSYVSYAGDVNKDGIDDIIIGANQWDYLKGLVCVIYGSKTPTSVIDVAQGLKPEQGFLVIGAENYGYLGSSVSWAGDVNNDGIGDVILSSPKAFGGLGAAYVIFGKEGLRNDIDLTSGLSPSDGFMASGSWEFYFFGSSVNGAGDVDGDGIADIIIGAYGGVNDGAVYLIYGKEMGNPFPSVIDVTQGLSPSEGFIVKGPGLSSHFGYSVGNAGDFNGDGYDDVIIGAPYGNSDGGTIYIILGGPRSQLSDMSLSSGIDPSRAIAIKRTIQAGNLGYAVNGAGDVNEDGIDDIIIGAPLVDDRIGMAFVVFGSRNSGPEIIFNNDLGPQEGFSIIGGNSDDVLGMSVSQAGDVNGDGLNDLVVGAAGANGNSGAAYVLFPKMCPEKCKTCEKTTMGKKCLSCETGYGLYDSKCIICPESTTELINGICMTKKSPLETFTGISKELFDSGSTTSRIFTMGKSLSVGLGLMAKIIQNVRYLNISYPQETLDAFESYGTELFELPIPEIFYESPETKDLPSQYKIYDISPTFMENYWGTIIMILISLACFFVIRLIQFLMKGQNENGALQTALKNIGQTAANFLVIQIYSNLDDVIFYFLLDTSSTKLSSPSARGSLCMACFFLLLGLCFVFFHCWLLSQYQQAKSKGTLEKFSVRYRFVGTLYEDFKDDNAVKQSFFGILILRCVFLVLVIMLLQPPWIQTSLLMLANLIFLGYMIYQRPFKSLFDEISQYFCELTIFTAYLGVLILSILDYQEEFTSTSREGFGKCIVIAGIVLSLGGFLIQVVQIIGAIHGIYQFFKEKKKKKRSRVSRLAASDLIYNEVSKKKKASKNTLKEKNETIELEWSGISHKDQEDSIEKSHYLMGNNLEISSVNTDLALILKKKSLMKVHPLMNESLSREMEESVNKSLEIQQELDGECDMSVKNDSYKTRKKFKRRTRLPDLSNSDDK